MMDKNKVWASVKSNQNGNKKRDFAGRIMDKSAYGDPNSEFIEILIIFYQFHVVEKMN